MLAMILLFKIQQGEDTCAIATLRAVQEAQYNDTLNLARENLHFLLQRFPLVV
jgi:hypothetical protein